MPGLLIIEDEERLAKNIQIYFQRLGWDVECAFEAEDGLSRMGSIDPDVVLLDFNLPGMDGLAALKHLRKQGSDCRIVMMTGQSSVQLAVDAMKAGASDFISKPVVLAELKVVLDRLVQGLRMQKEIAYQHARNAGGADDLLGQAAAMHAIRQRIRRIVQQESADGSPPPAVLILGETGTGKELVARACHQESPRAGQPFIELNCAAIPAALIESEIFGHERGAFTDAKERKIGLIEAADGGTLFLDEIGEIDIATQAKLLKVLDDFRVRRVGGLRERQVNVRIVAATNRNLTESVRDGRFRADLLHRLQVMRIELPPLRERDGDITLLAKYFLGQFSRRYSKPGMEFSAQAMELLRAHAWPGNVRELRNVIEQAVLVCSGTVIEETDLSLPVITGVLVNVDRAGLELSDLSQLVEVERALILRALEKASWNVSLAAAALGITRDVLRYSIKRHRLQP